MNIETVAEAIHRHAREAATAFDGEDIGAWGDMPEIGRDYYRHAAAAAVEAMGLNTEQLLHNGEPTVSRLVSPWVRSE